MPTTKTPVSSLIKKVEKIKKNFDSILIQAFEVERDYILKLQKKQLFNGENGDGRVIEPEYTETTKRIKKSKGQPINRVTLKDTGDFYKAMDVDFGQKDFTITNYDKKYDKLAEKYGDEILGLTRESQLLLKKRITQRVEKILIKKLL